MLRRRMFNSGESVMTVHVTANVKNNSNFTGESKCKLLINGIEQYTFEYDPKHSSTKTTNVDVKLKIGDTLQMVNETGCPTMSANWHEFTITFKDGSEYSVPVKYKWGTGVIYHIQSDIYTVTTNISSIVLDYTRYSGVCP